MRWKVWYDRKRDAYVSNICFEVGKKYGIPPQVVARKLVEWLKEHHPELEAYAS